MEKLPKSKKVSWTKQSWEMKSGHGSYNFPKADALYIAFLLISALSAVAWVVYKVALFFGWEII